MTTIALPPDRRARRRAAGCLLAGLALLWAAPAPAQAPDCALEDAPTGSLPTADLLEIIAGNLACLEGRIAALSEENAALRNRLDVIEDARGAAGAAYRNLDGEVDRKDRYLGPATFVVSGDRRGGARSLLLDHALVLAMCGDADGCLVTLGLTGAVAEGEPVATMFADGPCVLHLDGDTGAWSLSGVCAAAALPPAAAGTADPAETQEATAEPETADATETAETGETGETMEASPEPAPGAAPRWGRDGDARRFGEARRRAGVILDFAGACLLAEAAPETRRFGSAEPRLASDAEADLFLVAKGAGWDPEATFPAKSLPLRITDPDFDCRLTFRD